MAYWGVAYASGPFYNKPWEWYGDEECVQETRNCFEFIQQANQLKENVSDVERALIEALCQKHPAAKGRLKIEMVKWSPNYAEAMRGVYAQFPDDLDVICLTAEALMTLTPWQLWDIKTGKPASDAYTEKAIEVLQHGVDLCEQNQWNQHPGIVHFYIHVYEMSPMPEKALALANVLRNLCPDSGHLLHMASHIDALLGHWQNSVTANSRAIEADLKFFESSSNDQFYMISTLHNYHFKMYSAMFLGQFAAAWSAVEGIRKLVTHDMLHTDKRYLGSTLESYYSSGTHVLVRFGLWQRIIDEDFPDDPKLFQVSTIMLYYAKTIAYAAMGDISTAREYKKHFEACHAAIPDWHIIGNNPTSQIMNVAKAMMNGELEYHSGNHQLGYQLLREAARLSDNLQYSEPWPWMHPPRHALGALLLEQGHAEEALKHYEDDLGLNPTLPRCVQHPDNIWALHGYHECLKRLDRNKEAESIKPRLEAALARSDIEVTSSCCCRKHTLSA